MKEKAMKEIAKMIDENIEEFCNLHDLPEVPNLPELQEEIAMNIPEDISSEDYDSYITTSSILILKKLLGEFSKLDTTSFQKSFEESETNGVKMVDDIVDEFYNLHELPELPNIQELQDAVGETISNSLSPSEYKSCLITLTVSIFKKLLNKFSYFDSKAFHRAFNVETARNFNIERTNSYENALAECEDVPLEEDA